jgi:hypothetical protein
MIYLFVGIVVCAVLAGATLAVMSAMRDEHLLVLHWSAAGTVFLEKNAEDRYEGIRPVELPMAVGRYVTGRVRGGVSRRLAAATAGTRRHVLFPAHKA